MNVAALRRFPHIERIARRLLSIYPISARLGESFWKWYTFYQESETYTREKLREFQFEHLRTLLGSLASKSDFYARRLAGVDIPKLASPEDLRTQVPPLSRKEFSTHYGEIRNRDSRARDCHPCSTSGTTGNALEFFHRAEDQGREWAAICYQWKRVGFDPVQSRRAEFRALTRERTLFEVFPHHQMVRFSILDLRKEALPAMAEVIEKEDLRFYHGYPSALYLLATEVLAGGIHFPEPSAFLLASEMVYPFQVEQIRRAFPNAAVFAHYGCAERTVLAGWCEHRQVYHVLPQYSLVEVDRTNGEILGTNLFNDINGFVRYRMSDIATLVEDEPCKACRRPYTPVLAGLEGRQEDFLFSPENGWIPPAIVTYPLKHLHSVQELQFRQRDRSSIDVIYVPRQNAAIEVEQELTTIEVGLRELLGKSIHLKFRQTDEIPRGRTGKYKWIVSELDPPR